MNRNWQTADGRREDQVAPYPPHYTHKHSWSETPGGFSVHGVTAHPVLNTTHGHEDLRPAVVTRISESETVMEGGRREEPRKENSNEDGDDELLGLVVQFEDPTTPTAPQHKPGKETRTDTVQKEQTALQHPQPWNPSTGVPRDQTRTYGARNEHQEHLPLQSAASWVDVGGAFSRWQGIGSSLSLTSGQAIADFLIKHYEDTLIGKQTSGRCVRCQSPVCLSCGRCGWSMPHPDAQAPPTMPDSQETQAPPTGSRARESGADADRQVEKCSPLARLNNCASSMEMNTSQPESPAADDNDEDDDDEENDDGDADENDTSEVPHGVCECQICHLSLSDPGSLTLHLQGHLDEILYKCQESRRQAGFSVPDMKLPKLDSQTQTTQAGKGFEIRGLVRPEGGASKPRKRTHGCQAGSDTKRETFGSDADSDLKTKQKMNTHLTSEGTNSDVKTTQKKSTKQNTKSASAVKKSQPETVCVKSEAPDTMATETKPRGFSMIRWRQQRGEGLVAGQPTRCTQTPASDPLMPFVCLQCDAKFEHEHRLVMHLRKHTGERPYRCTECNATFAQSSHLKQHQRTHTGEKPHACPHCPARFARSGALASHINIHTGEKPHKCELCPAAFSHRTTLSSHMKVHTGVKPYLCPECGRTFAHTSNLKKHRITHTGLRPYICHQCSKAFSDPVNLKRHIRTHTGVKPYKCDQCLKAFGTSDALKVHMRTHSGERPYACQHCPKAFTTFQSLTKHISTQHRLASDMT